MNLNYTIFRSEPILTINDLAQKDYKKEHEERMQTKQEDKKRLK